MSNKKGFTLIELIAVVTIIGLVFILVIPKVSNSLKNKKGDVDRTTTNLVLSATKLYVQEHSSKFEKTDGNVSCMPINQLVRKGYLEGPVKNVTDDEDITDIKSVKITYDKGFKYELVNKHECSVLYNEVIKDNEGNKYEKVEYLESTGTQYIDTGIIANDVNIIKICFSISKVNNNHQGIIGGGWSSNNVSFQIIYGYQTKVISVKYGEGLLSIKADNAIHDVVLSTSSIAIDNNEIENNSSIIDNRNVVIFARNKDNFGSGIQQYSYIKVYYNKLYNNDILVRDYIPVLDLSNRPCLFDKVSKTCFYNQGTGEFLWG